MTANSAVIGTHTDYLWPLFAVSVTTNCRKFAVSMTTNYSDQEKIPRDPGWKRLTYDWHADPEINRRSEDFHVAWLRGGQSCLRPVSRADLREVPPSWGSQSDRELQATVLVMPLLQVAFLPRLFGFLFFNEIEGLNQNWIEISVTSISSSSSMKSIRIKSEISKTSSTSFLRWSLKD